MVCRAEDMARSCKAHLLPFSDGRQLYMEEE